MRPWIKLQILLILGCLTLNGLVAWQTSGYAEQVETARLTPAPQGQTYLNTCDGRPTDILGIHHDTSCLADYPGEFARGVILGFSIVLFLLVNLLYLVHSAWRRRAGGGSL